MRRFLLGIATVLLCFPRLSEARSLPFEIPLDLQFQGLAIEPTGKVAISDDISLTATVAYESVNSTSIGANEILLRHDGERISLWGGKLVPEFGQAWDQETMPIALHASEYEGTSQMGIGGVVLLGTLSGVEMHAGGTMFEESEHRAYVVSAEVKFPSGVTLLGARMKTAEREGRLVSVRSEFPIGATSVEPLLEIAQLSDTKILSAGIGMETEGVYYSLQHSTRLTAGRVDSVIQASMRWSR